MIRALPMILAALIGLIPLPAMAQEVPADPFTLHEASVAAQDAGDLATALSGFSDACELGLAPSCTMAGLIEMDRADNALAYVDAAGLLAIGCLAGSDFSCERTSYALGRYSSFANDATSGYVAIALMQMGEECRKKPDGQACYDASALLQAERMGGADMAVIGTYAGRACANERRPGCMLAAAMPAAPDDADPMALAGTRCDQGRADGCIALLSVLIPAQEGADTAGAIGALERACNANVGIACANLGLYRSYGPEAARDLIAGRHFMRAGCDGAVAQACFALAVMHKKGIGGPVDQRRSEALVRHACDLGWAKSCTTLARITELEEALSDRPDPAVMRQRACRFGDQEACAPATQSPPNSSNTQ
ncbi:hypothetical protein MB02_10295 [Croceicoccus estronivorus]|uniref:tetratricopeptide repeat protein n=1 Tax=Croceicoccus estronivorus TaxID=1172626 RepID=UPI000834E309|nr:sel1 repeat family protein [Croceicoccus estronivorus]OCC23561.1 hypothetical protein MB02_10295 [Croceicoccus estronivorus]